MTYTAILAVSVPVDLMARLDGMAREQKVTRSVLVRSALAAFAGMEAKKERRSYGNRDGREEEAVAIIREWQGESCRRLSQRLADAGIMRSSDWCCTKRNMIRREGH